MFPRFLHLCLVCLSSCTLPLTSSPSLPTPTPTNPLTLIPTHVSTFSPTRTPTHLPTSFPTSQPSKSPTYKPSYQPTISPTMSAYRFGQSAALSGIASDLGTNMQNGTRAAFEMFNRAGGIHGRLLELISYNDEYNPAPAANNTARLINEHHVIGCLAYCGTPTTLAALEVTLPARVPMLAPFTGARSLRLPVNRYLVNTRASYDDEIYAFVQYCLNRGITLFSIFYQRDSFGEAGLSGLTLALANQNLKILSYGTYERNTENVTLTQLESIKIDPQAIVMIGTGIPLAKFTALVQTRWPSVLLHSVSFLGSEIFLQNLINFNVSSSFLKQVFVTQVFPVPQSLVELNALNVTSSFQRRQLLVDFAIAMNITCPKCELTFGALEGFVSALLVGQVLQQMGPFSDSNADLKPYLLAENASSALFNLNDPRTMSAWREYFLDILFARSSFLVGGIRLGPYAENITCSANYVSCLQPPSNPCTQGMQNVFLTQPDIVRKRYVELFDWRVQSAQCNVHSQVVSPDFAPIVFGQTAVLTGATKALGVDMRNGLLAAFHDANISPSHGIRGRKLLLVSYDDYYVPEQAVINAQSMIHNQSLLAILGATGTPTSTATLPFFVNASVPFIGPFTGARVLRDNVNIINIRAQYDDECAAMVDYVLSRGLKKISLFRQDDSYGSAGLAGLQLALTFNRMRLHSDATYPRLTTDIKEAFNNLTKAGVPDVLVMFSTSDSGAAFIDYAENNTLWDNVIYFAVSFVGLEAYRAAIVPSALEDGRVLMTAVVPPLDLSSKISNNYWKALNSLDSTLKPTFGSLEGYLVGRLVITALERAPEVSSAALLKEIYASSSIKVDELTFGPYTDNSSSKSCNLGLRNVYVLRLESNETTTLLRTFRNVPLDSSVQDCGSFTLYDTAASCPSGFAKTFVNAANLGFICEQCLNKFGCDIPLHEPSSVLRDAMLGINIIGAIICVAFIVIILGFRQTVTVRAVSPPFCLLILFGAMSAYTTVFVLYHGISENICMVQIYLLNTSFCFIFGSLFAKVFRVTQIFRPRKKASLRVMKIKDPVLFGGVGLMWAIEMIFTIIWHTNSPLKPVLVLTTDSSAYLCRSEGATFGLANILVNGGFLTYGILLSFQSRKIPTVFNESKFVAATLYNTLILGVIFILACYNLVSNNDEDFMYKSLGVFIVITADVLFLLGSKLPSLYAEVIHQAPPKFKNDSSSSTRPGETLDATMSGTERPNSKTKTSRDKVSELSKQHSLHPASHANDFDSSVGRKTAVSMAPPEIVDAVHSL